MSKTKKIIIDVDTGLDDALALIFILKQTKFDVLGITTCGGNVSEQQVTNNTLKILSLLGKNIPVYRGSSLTTTGKKFTYAPEFHGKNGLGNAYLEQKLRAQKTSAVDFITTSLKKEKVTLVCLGPTTNLAKALEAEPKIKENIENLYIMGGAVNVPGNQSKLAEFNFYQDPEAIRTVISNLNNKISLIPLDVTQHCLLTKKALKELRNNQVTNFVREAITNWYSFFGDKKQRQFELYDPLAMSALFSDCLRFTTKSITIDTKKNKGAIIPGEYRIKYANKVDHVKFQKLFIETLNKKTD